MFYTYAVGIDSRHRKGEIVYHYEKRQHYILIYTRTTAQFQIDDEEIPVKKGTLLFFHKIEVILSRTRSISVEELIPGLSLQSPSCRQVAVL